MEQVPQAVVIAQSGEGVISFTNSAADRLWGWEHGAHPHSVLDLEVLDADGVPFERDLHPLMLGMRTGRALLGEPLVICTCAGDVVDVVSTIAPVYGPDGAIDGSIVILQDRTQFRRLEEAKEAFVAMVAHELRNPITAVVGNAQLLERQVARRPEPVDPELRDRISVLARQAGLMSGLVLRLLDRSRLEFGHLDIVPVTTDAVAIVQQASDDASLFMDGRPLTIAAPAQLPVWWDEIRMRQVMSNLLSNAARYGEGPVDVTVTFLPAVPECELGMPDRVLIAIRDHGPGIDAATRARLFRPHLRLPGGGPATGPGAEGHGLGIGFYLSERIVAAHGGTTTVEDADGGGARIVLEIPVHAQPGRVTAMEGVLQYGDR
ncbi:MAG: ATP-binding protein [Thermomicrobiales bacterium]